MTALGERLRPGRERRPRRRTTAAVTGLVLVLGAGTVAAVVVGADGSVSEATEVAAPQQTGPAPGLSAATTERLRGILAQGAEPSESPEPSAPAAIGSPRRLLIPSIGVDAGVVPIVVDGRELEPPADPALLGWWSQGAAPGDAEGSALITGHSIHTGGGALQDLGDLGEGDEVQVESDAETIDYVVTSSVVLDKSELAAQAPALFDQSAAGRVVLITCDDWNGSEWLSNSVVTAEPVDAPAVTAS